MNWLIANQRDSQQRMWPVIGGFTADEREPLDRAQVMRRLEWLTTVLDDRIDDRRKIKKMIRNWRADLIRA